MGQNDQDLEKVRDFMPPILLEDHFQIAMMRDGHFAPTLVRASGTYLQFGSGLKHITSFANLDWQDWDMESGEPCPYPDSSVEGIVCYHTLDHVSNPIWVMSEFQRMLSVGGWLVVCMPHYSSELWHTDLTHKSQFGTETWRSMMSERHYRHTGVVVGRTTEWKLDVVFNMMMGITERNLCLFTQFRKVA